MNVAALHTGPAGTLKRLCVTHTIGLVTLISLAGGGKFRTQNITENKMADATFVTPTKTPQTIGLVVENPGRKTSRKNGLRHIGYARKNATHDWPRYTNMTGRRWKIPDAKHPGK